MAIQGPPIRFNFDAGEYMRLCEIAQKLGVDVGTVLRIGGQMLIEAERRGLLTLQSVGDPGQVIQQLHDGKEPS